MRAKTWRRAARDRNGDRERLEREFREESKERKQFIPSSCSKITVESAYISNASI